MAEVKVKIPKAKDEEVVTIPAGFLGTLKEKFEKIDQVLFGIIIVLLISLVAIIVSVVGLFLDQMRYNNIAYREYSEKIGVVTINQELLEQNQQNQNQILGLQKQLSELLAKIEKEKNTSDNSD